MPTSRVTRKGQVTIPADIRRSFGIREGDHVQIIAEDDRVVLRRVAPWTELAGSIRERAHLLPTDEAETDAIVEETWTDTPGTAAESATPVKHEVTDPT